MNVFISALVAASTTAQLSAAEISSIRSQVEKVRAISQQVFLSDESFKLGGRDGEFHARLTLKPAAAGSYSFPGNGEIGEVPDPGLDLEMIIDYVNLETGLVINDDMTRFAKTLGKGRLKAYFCDSTSVCFEERGTSDVTINGDELIIANAGDGGLQVNDYFGPELQGSLTFHKAP